MATESWKIGDHVRIYHGKDNWNGAKIVKVGKTDLYVLPDGRHRQLVWVSQTRCKLWKSRNATRHHLPQAG